MKKLIALGLLVIVSSCIDDNTTKKAIEKYKNKPTCDTIVVSDSVKVDSLVK